MKTMKKLSALVLALMMVLSVAVSSAAAEDGEIMPRYRMGYCPICQAMVPVQGPYRQLSDERLVSPNECHQSSNYHIHNIYFDYDIFQCPACGDQYVTLYSHEQCSVSGEWLS